MPNRLFVHDLEKWQKNHRSHAIDPAQVHTYDNAIVLPMVLNPDTHTPDGTYRGGYAQTTSRS